MSDINILAVISKLRPRVKAGRRMLLDDLADEIAGRSGFDRGAARDFAYKFAQSLVDHLKYGDSVQLGELGSFGVGCGKDKQLRVSYRISKAVKNKLVTDFRGEFVNGQNAGLDDEGFAQLWLAAHPEVRVVMRDGTTRANGAG
jgi:nucleoid DNA-binding protein